MLLTITNTQTPAPEISFLLHKHPDKVQTFGLRIGKAHVFYPEVRDDSCTVALVLEIDPLELVRGRKKNDFALAQYVNDRPYVASSLLSTALTKVFRSAMSGTCQTHPELVEKALPLEASLSAVPADSEKLVHDLFQPLGYQVETQPIPLDKNFPDWGNSHYYSLKISQKIRLKDLLNHLYLLMPVLDNDQHYFVSQAEIQKLLDKGGEWLQQHPEKDLITHRFLKKQRSLSRQANRELAEQAGEEVPEQPEPFQRLHDLRMEKVHETIMQFRPKSVLDLGCGDGKLLQKLAPELTINKILGVDVSVRELERAQKRLNWDNLAPRMKERIELIQGALTYRDERFSGFDVAALVEVIEHLDPSRLSALERVIFEFAQPQKVIVTTPNSEYNLHYDLKPGEFRHDDHRFEWSREEFKKWAAKVAEAYAYSVEIQPVGEVDAQTGAPGQMAIFSK